MKKSKTKPSSDLSETAKPKPPKTGKPSPTKGIPIDLEHNRLSRALEKISFRNKEAVSDLIRSNAFQAVELAPAFQGAFKKSVRQGTQLAEIYANTLTDAAQHREFFQQVATMQVEERQAVITGYRKAGQARGVVHAISQLPRAYGRTLMRDFVLDQDQKADKKALQEVLFWLRDAGAEMRKLGEAAPRKANRPNAEEMDDPIVDFFEDVADALSDAVRAIVDAVDDIFENLGQLITDVVNWTADAVRDLVQALIVIAEVTIGNLLVAALEAGYELVKKIVAGIEAVGKAMFEVLEAAVNFAKDAFITVLRAIDQLGRQLIEFVSWLATKTFDIIKKGVEALIEIGKSIGNILEKALQFGLTLITNVVKALIEIGKTIAEILVVAITRPGDLFDTVVRSLMDLGRNLRNLLDEVLNAGLDLVQEIVRAAARIGTVLIEFTQYIATATLEIATKILQGLLEAGRTLIDVIQTMATHALNGIKKLVEAFFNLGKTMINLLKDCFNLAMNLLKEVVKAAFELGKTILEFTRSMVEFTYRAAARLIEAALEIGKSVAEILETVVNTTYYVFRKIVNGILQALGPVGEVLNWLLERGEALGSALWRETVLACRFVKRSINEVLDWAAAQANAVFESVIQLVESVGAAITEVVDWAISVGDTMLETLAGFWERLGNSITYALNYLEKDFIPGIAKFVKGAIEAGFEIIKLAAWMVGKALEVTVEALRGALAAGVIMATLIVETVKHPDQAMNNLMAAARQLGQTMNQLVQSIVEAGQEFEEEFVRAMVAIGEDLVEMLEGFLEVVVGQLDTIVFILMEMLNSFRRLTVAERQDAELVFGNSIDLDKTYIATESPTNSIIFGLQDFFSGNPDSRAFVTGNLINIDADDDNWNRPTLIHELTHVWQNQNVGPIYMAHAIYAQAAGEGYNYGYTEGGGITLPNANFDGSSQIDQDSGRMMGLNGETALANAAGNFSSFNPEQQGQIMMHYFVRRVLLNQTPAEYAPWQTYNSFVRNNPNVA